MKIISGLRVVVITFLIGSFLLTACAEAGSPVLDSTPEASQAPVMTSTTSPTETNTPEPGPSTANLPEGWADKIDHIENMTGMDGVERTVAVEKSADPDGEPKLRVLQWDGAAGEWTAYTPQVGKISANKSWWDRVQVDDLPVSELVSRMNKESALGTDGQEIEPGLVADLSDYTILCGDIVDFAQHTVDDGYMNTDLVIAVPQPMGDIELFYISGSSPDRPSSLSMGVYRLESVDPSTLWENSAIMWSQSMDDVFEKFPGVLSNQKYWSHLVDLTQEKPYRRIVFGVSKRKDEWRGPMENLAAGDLVSSSTVGIILNNAAFMSAEEFDSIQ